ncbi:MAG TPA: Holliday junction resolvase RuvX [Acidimicrobiales bacterium]|nr:Holliday junction resolvase RuvX [Acidimicrobiales bacterium]
MSSPMSDEIGPLGAGPTTGALATGRVIGLDLGTKRIGVALSDHDRTVASAFTVLVRSGSPADDRARIAGLVAETEANMVVVGLPLSLSGASGPAARSVEDEVEELRRAVAVPVELCDERFTTVIANRSLSAKGRKPAARRKVVDKMAAAAILQTWLDRQYALAGAIGGAAGSASQ